MPINVFGNSNSNNSDNKKDTSLFVQKSYLRTNYIEAHMEENIDIKNKFKTKNLPFPQENSDAVCKSCVDNFFNDPSIIKNTEHIDLNDRNITNTRFIQVNQLPQIDSHLSAKLYVDNAISDGVNDQLLLRLDPVEKLTQDSIILNSTLTSSKIIIEMPTKKNADSKLNDPSILENTDHVDLNDKDIDNVHSIKVNSFPTLEEQLTPKIYVDQAISNTVDESLLRLDPDEKLNLDEQDSTFLNSYLKLQKKIIEIPTKNYVDSLHEINGNRRDLSSVFNDQDNDYNNNKLNNLDSVTVSRNPSSDKELANKKYIDDELDKNTVFRFNQTLKKLFESICWKLNM